MNRVKLKATAIALLLLSLLIPTNIGALQGGPTMPEYMQFEPIDMPDVVNLSTGDFVYNLPLGEVPGPYGGFPLSMSYHAGITPAQEATWVGLGWTLNPGAINRNLRGAPDDQFHGGDLSFIYAYTRHSTWGITYGVGWGGYSVGMSYNSHSGYGVTAGIGFTCCMSFGVSFGENGTVGLRGKVGLGENSPVGISGGITFSENGVSGNVGLNVTLIETPSGTSIDASVGVQAGTGQKVSATAGVGLETKTGRTVKLTSDGTVSVGNKTGSVGLSKDGVSVSRKDSKGRSVTVSSTGLSAASSSGQTSSTVTGAMAAIIIPIGPLTFDFGFSRNTYESWVREATEENRYGYMYQAGPAVYTDALSADIEIEGGSQGAGGIGIPWNWNMKGKALEYQGEPTRGDLLPAYDLYSVTANGLSGTFRAQGLSEHKIFQSTELLNENDNNAQVLFYLLNENSAGDGQAEREFELPIDTEYELSPSDLTNYAYDWCLKDAEAPEPAFGYFGDQDPIPLTEKLNDGECSKYALLKSTHLNEANRLILRSSFESEKNFRSRMVFRFLGENSGYMSSEPLEVATSKYDQEQFSDDWLSANIGSKEHPLIGSRKIEPILEGGTTIGRLRGFKITRDDGSQFFYTQPVLTLMQADYTTNQKKGLPLFVDKRRTDDGFFKLLGDAFESFANYIITEDAEQILLDVIGLPFAINKFLVADPLHAFFFGNEGFNAVCKSGEEPLDEQYNFSYSLKTNPYATQWLLTEVRGPEFVLLDEANIENNIGYQVKLDYHDPRYYQWRFPYARPLTSNDELPNFPNRKTVKSPENCGSKSYYSSFGVKELVYLKSIETATHRADFVLNDDEGNPDSTERFDGKGWIHDMTGRINDPENENSPAEKVKSAVPIYVNTGIDVSVFSDPNPDWGDPVCQNESVTVDGIGYTNRVCWYEANVSFTVDRAYLNVQTTEKQKEHIKDPNAPHEGTVTIGGFAEIGSRTETFSGSADHPENTVTQDFIFTPPAGSLIRPTVDDVLPSRLARLNKGAETLEFDTETNPVVVSGVFRTGARSRLATTPYECMNDNDVPVPCDPDMGDPPSDNSVILDAIPDEGLTIGGAGHNFEEESTPQLIYTDFVSFNGDKDHQMAYLQSIVYKDKQSNETTRKFQFDYNYDLQPQTVNSYSGSVDLFNPDKPERPDQLLGKLTLRSVQETACINEDCTDTATLPPFRFEYKDERATTFRKVVNTDGDIDWDSSFIASTNPQDEWGFWNTLATYQNKKVNQEFADKGGTAWSLNRITDPLGGVMEVHYERDTYQGEWYGRDEEPLPVSFRRCGERGTPVNATVEDTEHLCIDFIKRKWVTYCDKANLMQGEYVYDDADGDFTYVDKHAIEQDNNVFFQLNASFKFEVGCGPFRLADCDRWRQVGVLGSGNILQRFSSTEVTIPYMRGFGEEDDWLNFETETIELDILYDTWERELLNAAEDFITDKDPSGAVHPRNGIVWLQNDRGDVKGGDIRVTKLVKKDIGLTQTTEYLYTKPGEMAQYPDSVLSTGFAQRFAPVKIVRTMASAFLPSMSRVPGITDDELIYLPQSKIMYPEVTVVNTLKDPETADNVVLNGKTVYEFFTTEQGIEVDGATGEPGFLKLKLRLDYNDAVVEDFRNDDDFTLIQQVDDDVSGNKFSATFLLDGVPIGTFQNLEFTRLSIPKERIYVLDVPVADADVATLKTADSIQLDIHYAFWDDEVGAMTETSQTVYAKIPQKDDGEGNLINDLGKYSDMLIGAVIEPFWHEEGSFLFRRIVMDEVRLSASVNHIKSSLNKPFLVRTSEQADETLVTYDDFQSYLGSPKATSYFRWMPDDSEDKNVLGDPVDTTKYLLVKKDEMFYAPIAPSADDRLVPEVANQSEREKIGVDQETWEYTRIMRCDTDDETCDDDEDFENFKGLPKSQTRKITYNRYALFTTKVKQSSGFNNSESEDDYIVTQTRNFRFDPVTGSPTFTVQYSGPDTKAPSKGTQMTPAFLAETSLSDLMFNRNMLTQNFKEEVFTWDVATTAGNDESETALDFNTLDFDDPSILPDRLTNLQITPYTQGLSNFSELTGVEPEDLPILSMGSFTPRFNLRSAEGKSLVQDPALFTPTFDGSGSGPSYFFLTKWSGSEIVKINKTFQPLEVRGPYGRDLTTGEFVRGRSLANRYDPRAFHQIGLFGNSAYHETATLTPEGYEDPAKINTMDGEDIWVFTSASAVAQNTYLEVAWPFTVKHRIDLTARADYWVEFQVYSPVDQIATVRFFDGAQVGADEPIELSKGLHSYQTTLSPRVEFCPEDPCPPNTYFGFIAEGTGQTVKIKYIRVYPKEGEANTFVYNTRGHLVQRVDENNLSTYFDYDPFGNLITIRNDDGIAFSAQKRIYANREGVAR